MKKASTRLLEQETQTPSPDPDLIPSESSTENLHWDWYSKQGHFSFAVMNGQTQLKAFVLLPGGAKARYVAGTISGYTVPDWVGSMRIGSKATQAYDFSLAFAPFGERYAVSGGSPYEFGGNQNNTVADEYDADNRKIHTSQGRWISPDPAGFGA